VRNVALRRRESEGCGSRHLLYDSDPAVQERVRLVAHVPLDAGNGASETLVFAVSSVTEGGKIQIVDRLTNVWVSCWEEWVKAVLEVDYPLVEFVRVNALPDLKRKEITSMLRHKREIGFQRTSSLTRKSKHRVLTS
jgi:hypothetical protein